MTFLLNDIYFGLIVLCRCSALLISFPMWGDRGLPDVVKACVAIGISFAVLPAVQQISNQDIIFQNSFLTLITLLKEVVIGALMGMFVRFSFACVELAGRFISSEIGFMSSEMFNPLDEKTSNIISILLFYFMTLLFFLTGIYREVIIAFAESYKYVAVGYAIGKIDAFSDIIKTSGMIFAIGFRIAAPFIAMNFVVTFSFAILGKVAPKINVFFISFAVRIFVGLLLLSFSLKLIYSYMITILDDLPKKMLEIIN